jgi:hypothetical protein
VLGVLLAHMEQDTMQADRMWGIMWKAHKNLINKISFSVQIMKSFFFRAWGSL